MRKRNIYGVPVFNKRESALLHAAMIEPPCKVCKAKAGENCQNMPDGIVHMGRLPDGFNSEKVVDAALAKLKV